MNTSNDCSESLCKTLSVIGDKYTVLIISQLRNGNKRFSELEKSIPNITPRTLTQRLDKLLNLHIIGKAICPESPGRYSYQLLTPGKELDTVVTAMIEWGIKHHDDYMHSVKVD